MSVDVDILPRREQWRRFGAVAFIYALVVVLLVATAAASPSFRSAANLSSVLRQSIVLGLVTIGQTYVLLGRGIDMSVGMTAKVVAISVAVLFGGDITRTLPLVVFGLSLGAAIGLVNGLLVTRINAAPFIVTLGTFGILHGVALAITTGPTNIVPPGYLHVYDASVGPLPLSVLGMAAVWLVAWVVLNRTRFGRDVYAVGGSPDVARLAAIKVRWTTALTYVVSGLCAAAAGLFILARTGVGDPSIGDGLEFQSIVAAAIGGVSLYGGRGSLAGTIGAVLLVTLVGNVFDMLNVNAYLQQLLFGVIVLVAVAVYKAGKTS